LPSADPKEADRSSDEERAPPSLGRRFWHVRSAGTAAARPAGAHRLIDLLDLKS
jgi:hypothetical protein